MLSATPATAQQPPALSASPNAGAPGTAFKVAWTGVYYDPDCTTYAVNVLWDGKTVVGSGQGNGRGTGSGSATVPATATAGAHRVEIQLVCQGARPAGTTFTVRIPPTTTTPPPTTQPPTTQPPVTNPPVTKPPVTRPPVTTTTTPPVTTTTTETTPPSSEPPSSSSTEPSNPGDGVLVLDKENIQPGDPLTATGTGCPKGAKVTLKSLGQDVGNAVADENGEFKSPVKFANIEPGRHKVRAECGITLVGNVDVTLSSSSGGTTSTLVVLLFFLLVGAAMLRRQFTGLRR
ncbi:hypothetical protein [Lentzea flava]|uniref:Carboxypeptidase regulatory-like domain-containing protein n=1 Tax=Lentzea flava TaxID=103732 RepID=A0ABQ2VD58_9PSEU|nr:hypothetical protein [Lentzea flava]GGU80637.1 hypothetical protein GCM10010178_84230 [Lentzea flava]